MLPAESPLPAISKAFRSNVYDGMAFSLRFNHYLPLEEASASLK